MSKEKNYCIYKHTSPSGKSYIGLTSDYKQRSKAHRNSNGCRLFKYAIDKHGWDSFKHEILIDGLTLKQANKYEEFYIKEHDTLAPNGYNLQTGGKVTALSNDVKSKLSTHMKDRWSKMSSDEIHHLTTKIVASRLNKTDEEKKKISDKIKHSKNIKTESEKNDIINKQIATMSSKSESEKANILEKRLTSLAKTKHIRDFARYGTSDLDEIAVIKKNKESVRKKQYYIDKKLNKDDIS